MNFQQIFQMLQNARNPMSVLQQLGQTNPRLQRVIEIVNGKNPKELEQYVRNTAQTQGVDLNKLAQNMGLKIPQ